MDVRKDFPLLEKRGITYFDNAATTQKPRQVIQAVVEFYEEHNANIHRGIHQLSQEATDLYEDSKRTVARFVGAPGWRQVVYVKNASEGLNLAARMLDPGRGDRILTTSMEHHSNLLPWFLARRRGAELDFVGLTEEGELDIEDFKGKVKGADIVAFSHASNVLGTVTPAREMARMAHEEGARVVLDAAQSVPHLPVDFRDIGADFMAFSGHKMLAPSGTGALVMTEEAAGEFEPNLVGGGTIEDVTLDEVRWAQPPEKFEAGTPNLEGAVGLAAAVDYLSDIGMGAVRRHEQELLREFFRLAEDTPMRIYGPPADRRTGLAAFTLPGIHSHDVADFLNARRIAVRSGKHCAHPLHQHLCVPSTTRASFHVYNTVEEIKEFFGAVEELLEVFA